MPAISWTGAATVRSRWVALWLFLVFFLLYLSTARAILEYGDDVSMLEVSKSIIRHGSFAVPSTTPGSKTGIDGYSYSKYGIGQSLVALPFVAAGDLLDQVIPSHRIIDAAGFVRASTQVYIVCLLDSVLTAGSVAVMYLACRTLSFRQLASITAAASLGISTFAWHYARTFMSEPTFMFAILLAFYSWLRYRNGRLEWLLLSGAAAGFEVLVRPAGILAIIPIGIGVVWLALSDGPSSNWSAITKPLLVWVAPLIVCLCTLGFYNVMRFGSPFESGYFQEARAFTTPLFVGLYGLTLSTGKGVAIYAPIVFAGGFGWFHLRRVSSSVAWIALLIVASQFVFYAQFYEWYGGGSWGPRFVEPVLPFLLLGLGAIIDNGLSLLGWAWIIALDLGSFAVQIVSVLEPYVPFEAKMEATPVLFERLLWNPIYSPVVAETMQLLNGDYPLDLAPNYYSSQFLGLFQSGALMLSCALLLVGVFVLWKVPRLTRGLSQREMENLRAQE